MVGDACDHTTDEGRAIRLPKRVLNCDCASDVSVWYFRQLYFRLCIEGKGMKEKEEDKNNEKLPSTVVLSASWCRR